MAIAEYRQQQLALQWTKGGVAPVPRQAPPPNSTPMQRWIANVVVGVAEIAAGVRQPADLHRVVAPAAMSKLRLLHAAAAGRANAPIQHASSVRVVHVDADTVEASAVVRGRTRYQAVALRLRRRRDRWVVTVVETR